MSHIVLFWAAQVERLLYNVVEGLMKKSCGYTDRGALNWPSTCGLTDHGKLDQHERRPGISGGSDKFFALSPPNQPTD